MRRWRFGAAMGALQGRDIEPQVFFLEASDEALIRRFSETRHRHPLDTGSQGIAAAIDSERQLLDEVRALADVIIDTTELSGRQLRERIQAALTTEREPDQMSINVISFGYKYGVPLEADLVFDVRFMENPFYVPELRLLSGLTEPVQRFVLDQPVTRRFLAFMHEFFDFAIPAYQPRARRGSPSRSAAPVASIARSPSPRRWPTTCASRTTDRSASGTASSNEAAPVSRA